MVDVKNLILERTINALATLVSQVITAKIKIDHYTNRGI